MYRLLAMWEELKRLREENRSARVQLELPQPSQIPYWAEDASASSQKDETHGCSESFGDNVVIIDMNAPGYEEE